MTRTYLTIGFSALLISACTTSANNSSCNKQCQNASTELACSPMIGHVSMRSANVWVQTETGERTVTAVVLDSSGQAYERAVVRTVTTDPVFRTGTLEIGMLEPGTSYQVILKSGQQELGKPLPIKTQPLWDFRTDPPAFEMLTGSCAFINEPEYDRPGNPYGGEYEIFKAMASEQPDVMLWLGDNVYLREVDFQSIDGYAHRYSHMRSTDELQDLLTACPHYAIWDDHDFGPNDCDRSWVHKDWAQEAFEAFWANPSYGVPDMVEGIVSYFRFVDMDFFLLDNRSFRVNHGIQSSEAQMLGEPQIEWLIEALRNSRAPFKFIAVGGQVVSDAAIYENFAQFPEERSRLLQRIDEEGIDGVVFLTGDRHNTELSRIAMPGGALIYDLTASPLTSRSYDHTDEPNSLRVEGTMVGERNYAKLSFSGPRKERVCEITVHNVKGEVLWTKQLNAKNWRTANVNPRP